MEVIVPDLEVVFETEDGYQLTPPPKAAQNLESPNSSPPCNTSTDSSDAPKETVPTSPSQKSLPPPVTDKAKRIAAPTSFAWGFLHGVLPFLIVIRFVIAKLKDPPNESRVHERWFKYGRSGGLILLLVIIIVLAVKLA